MKRAAVASLSLSLMLAMSPPAGAYPAPGRTFLASFAADGSAGGSGPWVRISRDGNAVTFTSEGALVPEDANGHQDVYVRDLLTGTVDLVSTSSAGIPGDDHSFRPSISADGNVVAFESAATNLVAGDTNAEKDVFVHFRDTGVTRRLSETSTGGQAVAHSRDATVSGDGRVVAFFSEDDTLSPSDTSAYEDIFVRDLETWALTLVTVDSDERQWPLDPEPGFPLSIDHDGDVVAWMSRNPFLDRPDANALFLDIFVRDLQAGTTERVSDAPNGVQGNNHSQIPFLSADGRYVAFSSLASNLVPHDSNGAGDVFVHDRQTGRTERVSISSTGAEATPPPGGSATSAPNGISAGGRFVAFHSGADNLDPSVPDLNGGTDSFVHDRLTGITELISVTPAGTTGARIGIGPSVSGDGRFVAFASEDGGFVPGDTNFKMDAFVRDRGPAIGVGALDVSGDGGGAAAVSGFARFSGVLLGANTDSITDANLPAWAYGAEISGASLVYRPEHEDLRMSMEFTTLPGAGPAATVSSPTLLYRYAFSVDAIRYQAEVTPPRLGTPATFTLKRCVPVTTCTPVEPLSGGMGTVGQSVVVVVPLETIEAKAGSQIRDITFHVGEMIGPVSRSPDAINLPNTVLPVASVLLGRAPAGTPAPEVVFSTPAALQEGSFSSAAIPGEGNVIWARACVGEICGTASKNLA